MSRQGRMELRLPTESTWRRMHLLGLCFDWCSASNAPSIAQHAAAFKTPLLCLGRPQWCHCFNCAFNDSFDPVSQYGVAALNVEVLKP